jgi:hypothetical protein
VKGRSSCSSSSSGVVDDDVMMMMMTASLLDLENTCYSEINFSATETSLLPVQSLSKMPNSTTYLICV